MSEAIQINGKPIPPVGFGTWEMGSNVAWNRDGVKTGHGSKPDIGPDREERDARCIAAIQTAVLSRLTFINGAQIYADGRTDELIGEALKGLSPEVADTVITSSKLTEASATNPGQLADTVAAIKERLGGRLDLLYLEHWPIEPGKAGIAQNIEVIRKLDPTIAFGVSNFTVAQLKAAQEKAQTVGARIVAIENRYSLSRPSDGYHPTLTPPRPQPSFGNHAMTEYCKSEGIARIAYTPFLKGTELQDPLVEFIARERGIPPVAVALGWFMRQNVVPIPKSLNPDHIKEIGQAMRHMQMSPLDDGSMRLLATTAPKAAQA